MNKYFLLIGLLFSFSETKDTKILSKYYYLPPITVLGNKVDTYNLGGGGSIDKKFIEEFPSGNGDITSLLKINPNVQFSNTQQSSKIPGEIDPVNISINGGLYYQNLFSIDGININNDLDPVSNNPNSITNIPGRSQGIAIDSSNIDTINVYDSNISAKYGGFEGGVVDMRTKSPSKDFQTKISYQTTGSAQTKYHIYPSQQEDFLESYTQNAQPEFSKQIIRAQASMYITKNFGLFGSFSNTYANIPLKGYRPAYTHPVDKLYKDNYRNISNYYLKAYYNPMQDLYIQANISYSPQDNHYFIQSSKNSEFSILSGGLLANLKTTYQFKWAEFGNSINFSNLTNSRRSLENVYRSWYYSSEKNYSGDPKQSSAEGGWGNIDEIQRKLDFKSYLDFEEFNLYKTSHNISTGIDLNYTNAYYQRLQDTFSASSLSTIASLSDICAESEFCSNAPAYAYNPKTKTYSDNNYGQFFKLISLYQKGKINLDNFAYGAYLEDDMTLWRMHLRVGIRLDGDTYMQKLTLAPRIALRYDVLANHHTNIILGYNRYYGRNLFAYALYDGRSALQESYLRTKATQDWRNGALTTYKNNTKFQKLKVPYNDEYVGGIAQKFWYLESSFKYVHREGKDEIIRVNSLTAKLPADPNYGSGSKSTLYYTYLNKGQTRSDIFTLSISNFKPLKFLNTLHSVLFALDYSSVKRGYNDYQSALNTIQYQDSDILFDNKIIKYALLPANNFNKPWTGRLTTISQFKILNFLFTWTNFLRYRSGYQAIVSIGKKPLEDGKNIDEYKTFDFHNAFNWDTRMGVKAKLGSKNTLFLNLDVFNLLDNINIAQASVVRAKDGTTTSIPTYETGRSFWIEMGYEF
ncbi:TonB-dependent receptor plug domain-containing protein [Helicobacter sp. 11S03491-1]|uniref:TonB-dependent receptor plug domain-containing protein n=1 Tax=Helicobacter sp. 11S03491-1 TaxID=1476196 RepID=UPI000BA734E1|nr:TonB-dependent receptor plug domain-containing protein [Helicobacter sp. 11S03491-1]PAF42991.1 hypothetical protein BKH45_02670 [Helicobacter sp. 11S03491-1]